MADRLPRYRPLGVSLAAAPRIDYAGAGAAEARGYQQMSQALDKISAYAFEEAGKRAAREGAQYDFENPITKEQIEAAMESGMDIDDVVGDPDTIYGSALRSSVGARLRTELEFEARKHFDGLTAAFKSGLPIDVQEQQLEAKALIAGHRDVLGKIDPEQANAYSASTNALFSAAFKTGLESQYKRIKAQERASIADDVDGAGNRFGAVLASAAGETDDQGRDLTLSHAYQLRDQITARTINVGDPAYTESVREALNKEISDQRRAVLANHLFERFDDAADREEAVARGDFGRYTALFSSIAGDEIEKDELLKYVRDEQVAQDKLDDAAEKEREESAERLYADAALTFQDPSATPRAREIAERTLGRMARMGQITIPEYNTATKMDDAEGGDSAVYTVAERITSGITNNIAELNADFESFNVPPKKRVELLNRLKTQRGAVARQIRQQANSMSGLLPDATGGPAANIAEAQAKEVAITLAYEQKVDEYENLLTTWEQSDKSTPRPIEPTVRSVAAGVIEDEITKSFEATRDEALKALQAEFERLNVPFEDLNLQEIRTARDSLPESVLDKLTSNQISALEGFIGPYKRAQKEYLEHIRSKGAR
jgi:hypothetical protein